MFIFLSVPQFSVKTYISLDLVVELRKERKKKKKTMLSSESKIKNDDEKQDERRKARNAFNVLDYVGHCHNALYTS